VHPRVFRTSKHGRADRDEALRRATLPSMKSTLYPPTVQLETRRRTAVAELELLESAGRPRRARVRRAARRLLAAVAGTAR
jgi:hypothetical protein